MIVGMGGNRELAERFIASLEARDWAAWAGLLHPAVVYEIPQSRERIRGRDRYLRFNQEYPGDWHLGRSPDRRRASAVVRSSGSSTASDDAMRPRVRGQADRRG